jgi:hypothetical protein
MHHQDYYLKILSIIVLFKSASQTNQSTAFTILIFYPNQNLIKKGLVMGYSRLMNRGGFEVPAIKYCYGFHLKTVAVCGFLTIYCYFQWRELQCWI